MKIANGLSRRSTLRGMGAFAAPALVGGSAQVLSLLNAAPLAPAEERGGDAYPHDAALYLRRLYAPDRQTWAFRAKDRAGFQKWQQRARAQLRLRLGIDRIESAAHGHKPRVDLGEAVDMGSYTRQLGVIDTEPDVRMPFWLLKPKGKGPWPLAIFPHGHSDTGHNTSAGVFSSDAQKKRALSEDRDVAVQAVTRGMVAIAPTVRGLSGGRVPDLYGRHGKLDCRSQAMHSLLAGRTASGERVWDISRMLDWAVALPEVDSRNILSMGNSGGGMVTLFAAASDERITVAVPSCSFTATVSASGYVFHCDCNVVPGLMELGGLPGVAGLIAPRFLLSVNGRKDQLHSIHAIESAAASVQEIYRVAGYPARYENRWGTEGHRFYKDLMWPFIQSAIPLSGA